MNIYHRIFADENNSLKILLSILQSEQLIPSNKTQIQTTGGNNEYIYLSPHIESIDPSLEYRIVLTFNDNFLIDDVSYWNTTWRGDIVDTTDTFDPMLIAPNLRSFKYKHFTNEYIKAVINQKKIHGDKLPSVMCGEIMLKKPLSIRYLKKIKIILSTNNTSKERSVLFEKLFKLLKDKKKKKLSFDMDISYQ